MILGKMSYWNNMYGNEKETACLPLEGAVLENNYRKQLQSIVLPNKNIISNS